MIKNDVITERSDLYSALEEADCRIIPHVAKPVECGFERIVVASNYSDVLIYNLAYFDTFKKVNACGSDLVLEKIQGTSLFMLFITK